MMSAQELCHLRTGASRIHQVREHQSITYDTKTGVAHGFSRTWRELRDRRRLRLAGAKVLSATEPSNLFAGADWKFNIGALIISTGFWGLLIVIAV